MGEPLVTHARFPSVGLDAGHYESFYLKASDPAAPRAIWIRYTVHKRPGEPPKGALWFTLFGPDGPTAVKITTPEVSAPADAYIQIGESRFEPGAVRGSASAPDAASASWELSFSTSEEPLFHLPRDFMYRAPVPRTKLLSPHPGGAFSGRVSVGAEEIDLSGWPGMVGHNWGAEHAERWIWLHGASFHNNAAWLDVGIGRIKLGPYTVPWIANGVLSLDGQRYRLGGIERVRGTKVAETPESADFVLPGKGITVRGRVSAPRGRFVGWIYADPDGSEHNTVNCSIAELNLTVERDGAPPLELHTDHGAAYELGMREKDHGMPIQPFPDG